MIQPGLFFVSGKRLLAGRLLKFRFLGLKFRILIFNIFIDFSQRFIHFLKLIFIAGAVCVLGNDLLDFREVFADNRKVHQPGI